MNKTTISKRSIGNSIENIAATYLQAHGLIIIERNFYCEVGEIDIICYEQISNTFVFVEVRYRKNINFGTPVESINFKKQQKLIHLTTIYIKQKIKACGFYNANEPNYRIDAVGVSGDINKPKIEWLQSITQ